MKINKIDDETIEILIEVKEVRKKEDLEREREEIKKQLTEIDEKLSYFK